MYFGRNAARSICCVCCSLTAAAIAGTSFCCLRGRAAFHHHHLQRLLSNNSINRSTSRLLVQRLHSHQKPSVVVLWNPAAVLGTGRHNSIGHSTLVQMSTDASMSSTTIPPIAANLRHVQERVTAAAASVGGGDRNTSPVPVRLVAVSKTKPLTLLQVAYDAGCRCFGENYVQELVEKMHAWNDRRDVQWHFIGALQSNKCKQLVQCCSFTTTSEEHGTTTTTTTDVTRLTVETVSSTKLAQKLNNAVQNLLDEAAIGETTNIADPHPQSPPQQQQQQQQLKVFVQVNTSGEDSKSGVEAGSDCVELCRYIIEDCPALQLRGLMTIGAIGDASCFATLRQCRDEVLMALDGRVSALELSMGMSDDFEQAIHAGATNVRVGSTIFGARDYSQKS